MAGMIFEAVQGQLSLFSIPTGTRDSPRRKRLDRSIKRLVNIEVLATQNTKNGGVAYALAETAEELLFLREMMHNSDLRRRSIVVLPVIPKTTSEEEMEQDIKALEASWRRISLHERRAIKKWRERRGKVRDITSEPLTVVRRNNDPILAIGREEKGEQGRSTTNAFLFVGH